MGRDDQREQYLGIQEHVSRALREGRVNDAMSWIETPILWDDQRLKSEDEEPPTGADGRYIRFMLMPEFWEQFARKAADYNDNENENHRALGVRGQFADIWRKIGKLKKALWEGRSLAGEQPREILLDLIAHCFLTIAMIDREDPKKPWGTPVPAPMASGEPWQGRTKANLPPPGLPAKTDPEPDPEMLWPACGRERCIAHLKLPYKVLVANGTTIYPGKPEPGTHELNETGEVFHRGPEPG